MILFFVIALRNVNHGQIVLTDKEFSFEVSDYLRHF